MSSNSSSEDEDHFESIIATRARRSNAGSRLRQLLDLEDAQNNFQTEDDENVNLLFEEEGEDEEFVDSDDHEKEEGEEEEDDEDEEKGDEEQYETVDISSQDNDNISRKQNFNELENTCNGEDKIGSPVDNDEMLSNSDISDSDTDESEGERELQHQEKIKRRRGRRSHIPHAIKKPKIAAPLRQTKKNSLFAVQLSPGRRRYSARKSTVENTIATHEKLEKENERKQTVKIVPKKEYVEKTLEERLEEAKITEEENKLSLTRFFEQEFEKKKKQRDLANSRKFKMAEFIRFYSIGKYVTALEEVKTAELEEKKKQEEAEKKAKRKKQYARRKKNQQDVSAESEAKLDKDNIEKKLGNTKEKDDTKLLAETQNSVENELSQEEVKAENRDELAQQEVKPEDKNELQADRSHDLVSNVDSKSDSIIKAQNELKTEDSKLVLSKNAEKDTTIQQATPFSFDENKIKVTSEGPGSLLPNDAEGNVIENSKSLLPNDLKTEIINVHNGESRITDQPENPQLLKSEDITKENISTNHSDLSKANKAPNYRLGHIPSESIDEVIKYEKRKTEAQVEGKYGDTCSNTLEKAVRFSDGAGPDNVSKKDFINDDTISSEGAISVKEDERRVYEGPPQFVAFNYVSFEEFHRPPGIREIKKYLFGPQSNLSGSLRDPHFKTMFTIRQDDSDSIDLEKIQEERNLSFQNLLRLPKFGEKYQIIEDLEDQKSKEEVKINITTPTPVGINLPNGNKKKCFINGEDASYYDPTNGIPYSSVECFKVLKRLAEGGFYWTQIDQGGINSRYKGGIGCYLGESKVRHAKGVPEGFE